MHSTSLFRRIVCFFAFVTVLGFLAGSAAVVEAQPVDAGFRGPDYPSGTGGDEEVTAEKPESKLWWNDGSWWGSLWSAAGDAYHIYRLDLATQQWIDTGTELDDRLNSKADVLWDDKPANPSDRKLYVASHRWTTSATTGSSGQHGRLYRYSYNWAAKSYSLDLGFPVDINTARTESLTVAKDSTGRLWATWVQDQQVMVTHSLNGDDTSWGTPFVLPVGSIANVTSDDLSAVAAFGGNKIMIMWSRQSSGDRMYAATHVDGASDGAWQAVAAYTTSGDDHISLKSVGDSAGQLFAVVKTADSSSGLIVVLVCRNTATNCVQASDWDSYPVYSSSGGVFDATRPILLIDQANRKLYVFASLSYSGDRAIFYKTSDMDNIQFAPGRGELFIFDDGVDDVNNPSSTKQNLDGTTGLVVLASAADNNHYYHNSLELYVGPAVPDIDVTPSAHDYGGVAVGGNAVQTIAIRNVGGVDLQVSAATMVGGQAEQFAITQGGAPFTVAPGATHDLEVRFSPTSLGLKSTTLQVTSNDPDENPVNVALAGTGTVSAPDIAVTPASHGFGTQPVGVGVTQSFTVSNTGTTNLVVSAPTLTGPDAAAFAIVGGQSGFTIPPAGNDTIQVRFTPLTEGFKSATLNIPSNDPDENPLLVALTGTGSEGASTPTFEEVRDGGSSGASSVTTATSLLGVSGDLYLAAVSTKPYHEVSTVSGLGLTWTRVATQCAGRHQTGIDLWWAQGAATTGTVTAAFASEPNTALIAVSRYSGVASTSPVALLTAGNTNGVNGACSGGSDSNSYSFALTTTQSNAVVYGAVAMRTKTHTPGAGYTERAEMGQGSGSDSVRIALSDQGVPAVTSLPLNGTLSGDVDWAVIGIELRPGASVPVPDIEVTPPAHDFGGVLVGESATRTFAIRNLGGIDLQVTSASLIGGQSSEFAITQGSAPFTVAPGATHNLDVRFSPASPGPKTTTLRLISNDADEDTVDVVLNGTGADPAPDIAVTPTSHNYGTLPVGVGVTRDFTVSNVGASNLNVGAPTLTGPDAGAFAIVGGGAGFAIPPIGSNTIQVRFTPPTAGSKSATLSIPSDDPDENPVLVALTGSGSEGATTPTFEEVQEGGSSDSTSVTTAASLLGVSGHLYLAAVSTKSYREVSTVSGLGLSWTRVASQCAGRSQTGIDLWWAQGAATTGMVTATLASAPNTALIVVTRYSGVASTNPVALLAAGNTNGVNGACTGGSDSNAYSFNVTTTQNNALVLGAVTMRSKTHTPGVGYTERAETGQGSGGDTVRIALSDRGVPTVTSQPLNGTLSGDVDWAVIGIELRPGTSGP